MAAPPRAGLDRNAVDREGELCARARVVGRLARTGTAAEPESIIEKRLKELAGNQIGDERVVVVASADGLALGAFELHQPRYRLGEVVPVLLQHRCDVVEPLQGWRKLLFVV